MPEGVAHGQRVVETGRVVNALVKNVLLLGGISGWVLS
jgi:hypothetical protein